MTSSIYYCTQDNNTCSKKEECVRYTKAENQCQATLFKAACTKDNNHILFIKYEKTEEGENQ